MSKPVAVIRTLEDSPVWLDRRLVEAYLRTAYRTLSPPFEIKIGMKNAVLEKWAAARNFQTCAIVTAWNPRSKIVSEEENLLKNKELEVELQQVSRLVLPGLNAGGLGDWPPEESFWVLGISANDAIRVGRFFNQNAVVWWEKSGVPELWWLF